MPRSVLGVKGGVHEIFIMTAVLAPATGLSMKFLSLENILQKAKEK